MQTGQLYIGAMRLLHFLLRPRAPGTVALAISGAALVVFFALFSPPQGGALSTLQNVCFGGPWVAAVAVLIVTLIRLVRSEHAAPVYNLLVAFGSALVTSGLIFVSLAFSALFDDSPDPFGRDIVIPEGLHMRLPATQSPDAFAESTTPDPNAALRLLAQEPAAIGGKPARPPTVDDQPSTLDLAQGMQGGIYQVNAQINPGEQGHAYLKVYEQTRNTRLSEERLTIRSQQIVGWSNDPRERFRYQVEVTVYEGDWGVYYPARFELWFVPASGAAERKLLEDIFKIEGWQR